MYKLSLTLTPRRHNIVHIVLQIDQNKTQPLIILTGIAIKSRPRYVRAACTLVNFVQCTLVKCNAFW